MLVCPVHGCGLPLQHKDRCVLCEGGHSFDVARSGYINLLQPQDRRSSRPGDTPEAVAARRRLHDRSVTAPLLQAIGEMIDSTAADSVLDAGCGEGFYLGTLAQQYGFDAHGVDISAGAIEAAAKRYPACEWIVANADRQLPYADASFSLVLSITARMNPAEFRRVLRPDGRLLVAVPAPEDLIELRGAGRERAERSAAFFADDFTCIATRRASTTAELDSEAVSDVLVSIYRPMQSKQPTAGRITFALDLLLFEPRARRERA